MMKLAYVTHVKIPANNAQSKQIATMASVLSEILGKESFSLITPEYSGQEELKLPVNWHRIRSPFSKRLFSYPWFTAIALRELSRTGDSAVITRDILIAAGAIWAGRTSAYEIHQMPKTLAARLLLKLLRRHPRFSLISISAALKERLSRVYRISEEKILVAHDGADLRVFDLLRRQTKEQLRMELGLPVNKTLLLHSGSISPERFWPIEDLLKNTQDFIFVQLGGLPEHVRYWQTRLHDPRLIFVPAQRQEEVFKYQVAVDLNVFFTTRDTPIWWCCSPLKIFEYMAAGNPILSTNIGATGEVVHPGNALCFDPDQPGSLRNALESYFKEPAHAKQLANQALIDVQQYSWHLRAEKILKFINVFKKIK